MFYYLSHLFVYRYHCQSWWRLTVTPQNLLCVIVESTDLKIKSLINTEFYYIYSKLTVNYLILCRVIRLCDAHKDTNKTQVTFLSMHKSWIKLSVKWFYSIMLSYLCRADHYWKIRARKQWKDRGKYSYVNRSITGCSQLPEGAIETSHGKAHIFKTRIMKVKTNEGKWRR